MVEGVSIQVERKLALKGRATVKHGDQRSVGRCPRRPRYSQSVPNITLSFQVGPKAPTTVAHRPGKAVAVRSVPEKNLHDMSVTVGKAFSLKRVICTPAKRLN